MINGAACTAVDRAEDERQTARLLNADAPAAMAAACNALGAGFVHYSTDYVFSGEKTSPYVETDATGPRSVYGATKLAGERAVMQRCENAVIFRTAWVYSRNGANFVNTMLRLARERKVLQVVNDQHGAPTLAADLAALTLDVIRDTAASEHAGGVYHAVGGGQTTWFDFCREIFALAGIEEVQVKPVGTADFPAKARRPA